MTGHIEVLRVDLDTDAVTTPLCSGDIRSSRPHERIEHNVPDKGKHPDKAFSEFQRERRRMVSRGGPCKTRPNLLEPFLVLLRWNNREDSCSKVRFSISPRLAFHQNKLNVVLHDSVRLIRLPEKAAPVAYSLIGCVGDFVPDNGCQVGETDCAAMFLYGGVERDD